MTVFMGNSYNHGPKACWCCSCSLPPLPLHRDLTYECAGEHPPPTTASFLRVFSSSVSQCASLSLSLMESYHSAYSADSQRGQAGRQLCIPPPPPPAETQECVVNKDKALNQCSTLLPEKALQWYSALQLRRQPGSQAERWTAFPSPSLLGTCIVKFG